MATYFQVFPEELLETSVDGEKLTLDVPFANHLLIQKLSAWENSFIAANDLIMKYHLNPLCVGLYNDGANPNAKAAGEDVVIFGVNLTIELQKEMNLPGEKALTAVLAHEFAHTIQNRHGLVFDYTLPMLSTKIKELQADCMAGMILNLHGEYDLNDVAMGERLLSMLGDIHPVGDHGMGHERRLAFIRGLNAATLLMNSGKRVLSVKSGDLVKACGAFYRPTNK